MPGPLITPAPLPVLSTVRTGVNVVAAPADKLASSIKINMISEDEGERSIINPFYLSGTMTLMIIQKMHSRK